MLDKFMIVSNLDQYQQYLTGYMHGYDNAPEFTPELFVRRLLRLEPATKKMEAGTTIHTLIENNPNIVFTNEIINYLGWHISCIGTANINVYLPSCKEVPVNKNGLRGRVDAIDSSCIHDLKVSSKFDTNRYLMSWQWRAYLWMTGYNNFSYDVLVSNVNEDDNTILIRDYQQLKCYRYPNLNKDVENCLEDFKYCLTNLKPLIKKIAQENNIILKGE